MVTDGEKNTDANTDVDTDTARDATLRSGYSASFVYTQNLTVNSASVSAANLSRFMKLSGAANLTQVLANKAATPRGMENKQQKTPNQPAVGKKGKICLAHHFS